MIRVARPAQVPAVLARRGRSARKKQEEAVLADPRAYRSGAKKVEIDSGIYGHADVKTALKAAQAGKCAFCEARVDHVAHGDVEHFRPKKGCRQAPADPLGLPGYYWLAYEWTNLLFSCQLCNQRHKGNLFPLRDPGKRARDHRDPVEREDPLFVDPASDDPGEHIGFRREIAYGKTDRGAATIEGLGLNRDEMKEARRSHLNPYVVLAEIVRRRPDIPEAVEARNALLAATAPIEPFSSMASAILADLP